MSVEKRLQRVGMKPYRHALTSQNVRSARRRWAISVDQVKTLKALTQEFRLSLALGDLCLLDGKWVCHPQWPYAARPAKSGLLRC